MTKKTEIKKVRCNICSAGCPIDAYVQDGKLLSVEGSRDWPGQQGGLCSKGAASRQYVYNKDRILYPMKRVGERGSGEFERISWEEAYAMIANNLLRIREKYGSQSTVFYAGYPKWYRPALLRLANAYGSPNYCTESSTCFQSAAMAKVILDLTCTGIQRNYDLHAAQILPAYAHALLDQLPCMRMAAASNRQRILEAYEKRIDGIIYHTVKFCDIYAYEYTKLHETSDLPILKIETDATAQCAGQILTRLEAFLESLRVKKGENMLFRNKRQSPESKGIPRQTADNSSNNKTAAADHPAAASASAPVYVMGIDSGSTSTNAVILNQNRELIASAVIRISDEFFIVFACNPKLLITLTDCLDRIIIIRHRTWHLFRTSGI